VSERHRCGDAEVLVRGWLHGNVLRVGRALVDTGYHTGAEELGAFVGQDGPAQVVLTHVHADHCGGVAALKERWGCSVAAHVDAAALISAWDERGLWLTDTGQHLPRFVVDTTLEHGDTVDLGGRPWTVLHTPGHATGGLAFFDSLHGVLVTGDALWEDGFGLLDPWVDGAGVFEDARLALDRIAETGAHWVVPGHGRPFAGLGPAVARARSRLDHLERHRDRLLAQILRNGFGFACLAHPDWSPAQLRSLWGRMARLHGITDPAEVEARWQARPARQHAEGGAP
jgi:glyoxylase-like metal-dependent hydrolase (beta-lactamase superfamily II)